MPPSNIRLRVFCLLGLFATLAHFQFVEFRLELIHGLLFVAVLTSNVVLS